jgi:hypothetical protein
MAAGYPPKPAGIHLLTFSVIMYAQNHITNNIYLKVYIVSILLITSDLFFKAYL